MQSPTEQLLLDLYGPLLTLAQLADLFHRTPSGLRFTLSHQSEFSSKVNSARIKLGRRVYFRTTNIAALLSAGGTDE